MKFNFKNTVLSAICLSFLAITVNAQAAKKTYQVTGPILDMNETSITVQKGSEKWEIQKDATTTAPADLKKGDKVTIQYTMTATSVVSKAGAPKAEKKAKKAK